MINSQIFRSLDINTLIGNVGGYIGLLIGFSICDVPILLQRFSKELMKIHDIRNYLQVKYSVIGLKLEKN